MTRRQFAVMLVRVGVVLTAAGCAQEAEFKVPDGWVVAPENDKAEGEAGYRILHEETGIELLYVPGGTFMMGSADDDPDAYGDEEPQHEHSVEAFWIGRTEVTVGQWGKVMGDDPGLWMGPIGDMQLSWTSLNDQGDDHPVVMVSRDQATEFCGKLGLELPTEAQWEYAARGPENRVCPWGDEWDAPLCQSAEDDHGHERTAPVGSLPGGASWCGALDMAGNAWEWCDDWYDADAYKRYAGGDLTLPKTGSWRVLRGGSWIGDDPRYFRCAYRDGYDPSYRLFNIGFRCALDA